MRCYRLTDIAALLQVEPERILHDLRDRWISVHIAYHAGEPYLTLEDTLLAYPWLRQILANIPVCDTEPDAVQRCDSDQVTLAL